MRMIDCDPTYSDAILTILNDAIVNSTALYDYQPRTPEMMVAWFETKRRGNFPVIGVVNDADVLMGFATYGTFRAFPAYKYTVEHSLYVAADHRGKGLGRKLLEECIRQARSQQYHAIIGVIDAENAASIRLHERTGFARVGMLPQVGFKFGRWLDVCLYQLTLESPGVPVDG